MVSCRYRKQKSGDDCGGGDRCAGINGLPELQPCVPDLGQTTRQRIAWTGEIADVHEFDASRDGVHPSTVEGKVRARSPKTTVFTQQKSSRISADVQRCHWRKAIACCRYCNFYLRLSTNGVYEVTKRLLNLSTCLSGRYPFTNFQSIPHLVQKDGVIASGNFQRNPSSLTFSCYRDV